MKTIHELKLDVTIIAEGELANSQFEDEKALETLLKNMLQADDLHVTKHKAFEVEQ